MSLVEEEFLISTITVSCKISLISSNIIITIIITIILLFSDYLLFQKG